MIGRSAIAKVNAIRLKRQIHKGCFLVVEGRDDRLFFEQFADPSCWVITGDGKADVINVVKMLEADRVPGIVGIVDADFDHVEGQRSSSNNVIVLETVDLEALLVRSAALERVLVELGSRDKVARFGRDVRDELVAGAAWVGCLKLHSLRSELQLRFEGLRYRRFVDNKSLTIGIRILIQEVLNRSGRRDLAHGDLERAMLSIHETVDDCWSISYGADMVEILAIGLRKTLGTNSAGVVKPEIVKRCLRLAFQWSDLRGSGLDRGLREWAGRNSGYSVLAPEGRDAGNL